MLQSFWLRNLKPALRAGLTLIGLARELDRGLIGCRAPWCGLVARAPCTGLTLLSPPVLKIPHQYLR